MRPASTLARPRRSSRTARSLQYNQGLVQLQEGKTDDAIRNFKGAARGAMKRGDRGLLGRSFFNLGSALSRKGDAADAVRSYLAAINSARQTGDRALDQDARKNLELLMQQQEQQKQKQKQDQQKQGQQKPQQSSQENQSGSGQKQEQKQASSSGNPESGSGNQADKQQQQQQQQQGDQKGEARSQPREYTDAPQDKSFSSPKLSADDAERVMQEIRNNEQSLQARRQRQQNGYGTHAETGNTKDW